MRERINTRRVRQAALILTVLLSGCAASPPYNAREIQGIRVVRTHQAQVDRACRNAGTAVQHPGGQIQACAFRQEGIILIAKDVDPYAADRYL
ncbi:MAG: hypothetical protein HYZ11_06050 [Candidatus Tectomicrobia bacterium]|uniref:Hemolysin n=1 Tax=Tectimicrobiota bacterium TaxID=2528274 RepID=A0A932I0G5_UNCTE|nr:hypothetical protein [Candidatus Tectomicrobia bacterium]